MGPRKAWTNDEIALLGTMPDADVATKLNRTPNTVANKRIRMGKKAFQAQRAWVLEDIALLGTMTDKEVGEKTGRSPGAVYIARRARGLKPADRLPAAMPARQKPRTKKKRANRSPPPASGTQCVFEAVSELYALERLATNQAVAELTGLSSEIVADRLAALTRAEFLERVARGIYVPTSVYPAPRCIHKTVLPCGMLKIEIGDEVMTITPHEGRRLAQIIGGTVSELVAQAAAIRADIARLKGVRTTLAADIPRTEFRPAEPDPAQDDWVSPVSR